jgi:hypothetical protein
MALKSSIGPWFVGIKVSSVESRIFDALPLLREAEAWGMARAGWRTGFAGLLW